MSSASDIIETIKRKLPKWRNWFPNERSEVEIPREDLLLLVYEIDRLNELLSTITADASWCGYEGDVSVNVTLWDIPQCDGRGGLTLLQAAEKARTK